MYVTSFGVLFWSSLFYRHRDFVHKDHAEDLWHTWEDVHVGDKGKDDGKEGKRSRTHTDRYEVGSWDEILITFIHLFCAYSLPS